MVPASRVLVAFTALVAGPAVANRHDSELGIPVVTLSTDIHGKVVQMPMGGIGTWLTNDTQAEKEVSEALSLGARLIDTAYSYGNQVGVGRAIKKSGIARERLFISTKVPGGLDTQDVIAKHDENLQQLGVNYTDLLLTHFPCAMTEKPSNCSKAHRQATWRGLESIYRAGKARAIGVSHYCQKHLEDIFEISSVPVAVNQQEWHVGMGPDPEGVVSFGRKHGVSYQSFSPLCGPCSDEARGELVNGTLVSSIGRSHNVSGAQVSLKWLVNHRSPVIPRSAEWKHLYADLDLFNWDFTAEEMAQLDAASSPASAEPVSGDCKLGGDEGDRDTLVV